MSGRIRHADAYATTALDAAYPIAAATTPATSATANSRATANAIRNPAMPTAFAHSSRSVR
jgi:hypothetical protein